MEASFSREYTVLLIDDDPADQELFARRLAEFVNLRCKVVTAANFDEAEQALRLNTVDICLLDYLMEPLPGLDMLPKLRAAGLSAPVIVLTAHNHEEFDLASLAAGADGFLPKQMADSRMLERSIRYAQAQYEGRQRLQLISAIDPVTEVLHRNSFREQLAQALMTANQKGTAVMPSVAYFGIRGFKKINARYGQEIGDLVLQQTARRLQEHLGPSAVLGRMLGDEFAAFATDVRRTAFASRVSEAVSRGAAPIEIDRRSIQVELVAGINCYPYDASTATLLLERAEMAMHAAKESSEPSAVQRFDMTLLSNLKYREALERELRLAVDRNRLTIALEPVFRASDRKIVAAEVLSRWEHHSQGWISPGEFIPLAERSDLILALTDSVLAKAADCLHKWLRAGLIDKRFRAYVNIPAVYLQLHDAEERLLGPLRARDLPGGMLGLELTERGLFEMDTVTRGLLGRLREAGVSLVIDDFGTGFSSLSYLCELPIDQIKIDRSFLQATQSNPRGVLIIRSIVALGASLGLSVLAEGVETEAMEQLILKEGAEFMQGYLYGKSQSTAAFADTLAQQTDMIRS